MKTSEKKILGRWLEGMGIAFLAGTIMTFPIYQFDYWYFFLIGIFFVFIGTKLYENNQ
jgi:hypothetical protein